MRIRTVCFDLDDTLIPNTYKYHRPIWRCGMIVSRALGHRSVYPPDLLKLHSEIDQGLVGEMGFSTERFPLGWVRTYERAAADAGVKPDPAVAEELRRTAAKFKEGPFQMFRGAKRVLRTLARQGRKLHVVTAGNEALQRRKIDEAGVASLVDGVHVTPMHKRDILASIVGGRPEEGMMVGDSKKSDILPAIELGMAAAWLPSQTWSFVNAEVDEAKYHRIGSIQDLLPLLERLG